MNDGLLNAAGGDEGAPAAVHAMSAESAQLLGELRSRQRAHYCCPISGLERSAASPAVQAARDEVLLDTSALFWHPGKHNLQSAACDDHRGADHACSLKA